MSRYFALPVFAIVMAAVGARALAPSAPSQPPPVMVVELSAPEYSGEVAPAPVLPVAVPAPPVAAAPVVIFLEPLQFPPPPAPIVRTEVIERTVVVPQTTVVYAPTVNYYSPEPAPAPKNEIIETTVIETVFVCPTHHRPTCCPAPLPRPAPPQDTFFRTIPFMPTKPLPGIDQAIKPLGTASQRRSGESR